MALAFLPLTHLCTVPLLYSNSRKFLEINERNEYFGMFLMVAFWLVKFVLWPFVLASSTHEITAGIGQRFR